MREPVTWARITFGVDSRKGYDTGSRCSGQERPSSSFLMESIHVLNKEAKFRARSRLSHSEMAAYGSIARYLFACI